MQLTIGVILSILSAATGVQAHFRVPFPGERNATNWDTQTESPCGGDNYPVLPAFEWNPAGSPVEINYKHNFGVGAIYFCGNGDCTTGDDFDELIYEPVDQHKGNFCIPSVQLPAKYNKVNQTGVVQIIYATLGKEGGYEYMYNCVDVVVSENGPTFNGQCANSTDLDIAWDEGAATLVSAHDEEQIDKIATLTYLDAFNTTTAGSASTTSSMDMGMGGMTMDGMTMEMSTSTDSTVVSTTSSMDMDMGGMTMDGMTTATTVAPKKPASSSLSISSSGSASTGTFSEKVSTAGASSLTPVGNALALLVIALL